MIFIIGFELKEKKTNQIKQHVEKNEKGQQLHNSAHSE